MRQDLRQARPWQVRVTQRALAGLAILLAGCFQQPAGEPGSAPAASGSAPAASVGAGPVAKQAAEPLAPLVEDTGPPARPPMPELLQRWDLPDISEKFFRRGTVERTHSADEWIGRIEAAFRKPATAGQPAVIVAPVVDQGRAIRLDGPGLSLIAAISATYSPQKRLKLAPSWAQRVLADAGCWAPGSVLDHDSLGLCAQACEAEAYALPVLDAAPEASGQLQLTVTIHSREGKQLGEATRRRLTPAQLPRVPGLIARDVLQHFQLALSAQELSAVLTPQLQSPADAMLLTELVTAEQPDEDAAIKFLAQNPGCVAAWRLCLAITGWPDMALTRLESFAPPLDSLPLATATAVRLANLGRPEAGLSQLLELAASHAGDSSYHYALMCCVTALEDDALTRKALDTWTSLDPGYRGSLGRATFLLDWAGISDVDQREHWVSDIPDSRERARAAKAELEQAVQQNDRDWIAHVGLLKVAGVLDLPPEFAEQHFAAAIQQRPNCRDAYVEKLDYLRSRYDREPARFLEFARTGIETKLWKQRIPQVVWEAVHRACRDDEHDGVKYSALKSPELWAAVKLYCENLEASPASPSEKETTARRYALWGAYSGHGVDVSDIFWKPPYNFHNGIPIDNVYGTAASFGYVGELLDGQAGYGYFKHSAAASVALARGELDEADRQLQLLRRVAGRGGFDEFRSGWVGSDAGRLESALAQARRLNAARAVDYSPADLRDLLSQAYEGGLRNPSKLSLERGKLLWRFQGQYGEELFLPFGIRHGVISGTWEWTPSLESLEIIAHTRAPRDRITMAYDSRRNVVQLLRNGIALAAAEVAPGPQQFRLEFGSESDRLQPCAGVVWEAAVLDDVPSGFGFRFETPGEAPFGSVALGGLRIELRD